VTIIRPTTINARFSQPVGLGGEKLWLCPTFWMNGQNPSASFDYSGNRNHGVVANNASIKPDNTKGQFAFDFYSSSNQYVSVPTLDMRNLTQFSWSAWIRNTRVTGVNTILFSSSSFGGSEYLYDNFIFYRTVSTGRAGVAVDNNSNGNGDGGVFPNGVWNHAAVVFDGNGSTNSERLRYFLNGQEVSMTYNYTVPSVTPNRATTNVLIGGYAYNLNANNAMDGQQDDIRVFKRTLTPVEIKHLASYRGVLGSPRQPYDPLKRTVVRVPAAIPAATKVGSFKKPTTISKPSYQAGYARNASESENPQLWDGLVGAWMPSLGVTGETLRDVSGNGNHGTLTNMDAATDWVATSKGLALDFDGVDDYVELSNGILDPNQDFTVSTFVRVKDASSYKTIISNSTYTGSLQIRIENNNQVRIIDSYQADVSTFSNFTASVNTWYGIVVSRSSDVYRLYVDGEFKSSFSSSNVYSTQPKTIGTNYNNTERFNGDISNVSAYNRALSPSEIKHLYIDSLAPFRKKQRVSVAVPAAVPTPSATYHPLRSLAHPLEQ
jgi:hypothetical protein